MGQIEGQAPATTLPSSLQDGVYTSTVSFVETLHEYGTQLTDVISRFPQLFLTAISSATQAIPQAIEGQRPDDNIVAFRIIPQPPSAVIQGPATTPPLSLQDRTLSTMSYEEIEAAHGPYAAELMRRFPHLSVLSAINLVGATDREWSEYVESLAQRYATMEGASPVELELGVEKALETTRSDIKANPTELLNTLIEKFKNKEFVDRLKINFINEAGVDAGGLSRDFITELFSALTKQIPVKEYPNGFLRPELKAGQSLDDTNEKTFQNIGRLMMFCLNASDSYPIGPVFDRGVYAAIQAFTSLMDNKEFLKQNFDKLLSIYKDLHAYDKSAKKSIEFMEPCLAPWNDSTKPNVIKRACSIVEDEDALPLELQGIEDVEELKKLVFEKNLGDTIQNALRKYCMEQFLTPKLAPLFAIAQGICYAESQPKIKWEDIIKMKPKELEEAVQGATDIETIRNTLLKKVSFRDNLDTEEPHKAEWVKQWLQSADEETIRKFLFLLSASDSIGTIGERSIANKGWTIGKTSSDAVIFHTCFNMLDFPFHSITSAEHFKSYMEDAMKGGDEYTTG